MWASFCTSGAGTKALDGFITSAIRLLMGSLWTALMAAGPERTGGGKTFSVHVAANRVGSWRKRETGRRRSALVPPLTCAVLPGGSPVPGLDEHLLPVGLDHVNVLADLLEGHLKGGGIQKL